jgi:hypothetical protein
VSGPIVAQDDGSTKAVARCLRQEDHHQQADDPQSGSGDGKFHPQPLPPCGRRTPTRLVGDGVRVKAGEYRA